MSASDSSSRPNRRLSNCPPMPAAASPRLPRPNRPQPSSGADPRGGGLAHALTRMFAQRVGHLVAHDRRPRRRSAAAVQDAEKKAILPPGMQKALSSGLPIRITSQRHFAARGFQAGGERDDALGDVAQPQQLRVVVGRQRALGLASRCICRTAARRPAPPARPAPACEAELRPTSTPSRGCAPAVPMPAGPSSPSDSRRRRCVWQLQPAHANGRANGCGTVGVEIALHGFLGASRRCSVPSIVAAAGRGGVHFQRPHAVTQPPKHPQRRQREQGADDEEHRPADGFGQHAGQRADPDAPDRAKARAARTASP